MSEFDSYIRKVRKMGVTGAKIINTRTIVVGNWVRLKCQFGCGGYNDCLTCPPFSPTPETTKKVLKEYTKGMLMQIEDISPAIEDRVSQKFKKLVVDLERDFFLHGYYKAYAMVMGPCSLCRVCDLSKRCKHPHQARPSMEACGIDVYETARNNGFTLEVVKSESDLCSYVALILIE